MLLSILPAVGDIGLYARKIWDIAQIAFPCPMFAKSAGITKTKKQQTTGSTLWKIRSIWGYIGYEILYWDYIVILGLYWKQLGLGQSLAEQTSSETVINPEPDLTSFL